jgi:hypothetical protein
MGDIILSKILIASFGFRLKKLTFFLMANRTCIALLAIVFIATVNFPLGVSLSPRYRCILELFAKFRFQKRMLVFYVFYLFFEKSLFWSF